MIWRTVAVLAFALALAGMGPSTPAEAQSNGKGHGASNGKAWGRANNGSAITGGSGGSAPLPALGVTLLGSALGAGGLLLAWRRRQTARTPKSSDHA